MVTTFLGNCLLAVVLMGGGGCSGGGGGEGGASGGGPSQSISAVASIVFAPQNATIPAGQSQQFTATAKDSNGNTISGLTVTWSSSSGVAATISTDGLATGLSAGSTIIGATIGTVSSGTTLTVTQAVASITITPSAPSIQAGEQQPFTAIARDSHNQVVPNVTFTWTSSNQGVATIATSGLATGGLTGTTTIRAAIGAVNSNSATLTVTPSPVASIAITPLSPFIQVGQQQQFTATAIDGNNQVVPNVTFTWMSSLTGVASITTTGGLATGASPGATTITAAIGPVTSSPVTLTVTPQAVKTITLSPTTASILVNQSQQFTATARDAFGNVVPNVTFTWVSSSPGVASIDATGFATAGQSAGTTMIAAIVGAITSSGASLQVTTGSSGGRVYTTNFSASEDPIFENGNWINGEVVGLDWTNVSTTTGRAFGPATGSRRDYDDAVALLTGTWGPDQTVEATVYTVNQNDSISEEVELRLRSTLSPNRCTGYEVLFSARSSTSAYIQIVRWNGAIGNFTVLTPVSYSLPMGINTGDVVKATIVGDMITAYVNGVQKYQAIDSTYSDGSPGMGFYLSGAFGVSGDYGFTRFSASSN